VQCTRCSFGVPSMIDSLEVDVLYPAWWRRRINEAQGRHREVASSRRRLHEYFDLLQDRLSRAGAIRRTDIAFFLRGPMAQQLDHSEHIFSGCLKYQKFDGRVRGCLMLTTVPQ
jgi:hypothetical protein